MQCIKKRDVMFPLSYENKGNIVSACFPIALSKREVIKRANHSQQGRKYVLQKRNSRTTHYLDKNILNMFKIQVTDRR